MTISDADRLRMLTPRPGRVRAILDTDTYNEIDDQFALVHTLLAPDLAQLEAIYRPRSPTPGRPRRLRACAGARPRSIGC